MMPNITGIWTAIAPALANHLWQSTLFAAAVGALALALRKNQARVRYWLWLAASVKFLIPFSMLVVLGGYFATPSNAVAPTRLTAAIDGVAHTCAFCGSAAFLAVPIRPTADLKDAGSRYAFIHFLPLVLIAIWLCGFIAVLLVWSLRWRRMRQLCRESIPLRERREIRMLRILECRAGIRTPIGMLLSPASLEPGIFGIFQPVLIWPEGISARLEDGHLESILAHEVWHVRRRDNLMAAIHMAVEAVFWFHPIVWWLGARLVEERERACDEAVVELSNQPQVYAESILKACEFSVASPLACVSGVTGADLKKRIVRIMTERASLKLNARKKLLLVAAGFLAIALPVGFGLAHGKAGQGNRSAASRTAVNDSDPRLSGQSSAPSEAANRNAPRPKFEVASIKPDGKEDNKASMFMSPGGRFSTNGVPVRMLIEFAYHLKSDDQIVGAPSWVNTEKFDIEAKADDATVQNMRKVSFDKAGAQMRLMVQSLLADRFNLKVSPETQQRPVYALVVAKNGPKLTPTKLPPLGPIGASSPGPRAPRGVRMRPGELTCMAVSTGFLADVLSRQPELGGRVVVDETGLKGSYDFTLKFTPEFQRGPMGVGAGPGGAGVGPGASVTENAPTAGPGPVINSYGPSIFTALQQQLGLRLKPAKGPVEVLVIDHIEPPTPN